MKQPAKSQRLSSLSRPLLKYIQQNTKHSEAELHHSNTQSLSSLFFTLPKKHTQKKKKRKNISVTKNLIFSYPRKPIAMTKIDALRRYLLSCFSPPTTSSTTNTHHHHHYTTKKRISTSLREDLLDPETNQESQNQENQDSRTSSSNESRITTNAAPPRPSKTMVVGTIFGNRRGNKVWFCIQFDRFSTKSLLLLELNIPTHQLVKEMQCGLVRIALECNRPEFSSCPLRSIPVWTMYCNGKKTGFALKRKASDQNRLMLKTMQSTTVGAGVIPAGYGSLGNTEEIMYMRANYEHVVGNANTESFHLINLDECVGQELSVFLMRSG